jgi:hypothetical protein
VGSTWLDVPHLSAVRVRETTVIATPTELIDLAKASHTLASLRTTTLYVDDAERAAVLRRPNGVT